MRRADSLQALGLLLRCLLVAWLAVWLVPAPQAAPATNAAAARPHHRHDLHHLADGPSAAQAVAPHCADLGLPGDHAAVGCSHCTACTAALPAVAVPARGAAGWQAVHLQAPTPLRAGRTVVPETPPPIA